MNKQKQFEELGEKPATYQKFRVIAGTDDIRHHSQELLKAVNKAIEADEDIMQILEEMRRIYENAMTKAFFAAQRVYG